MIRFYTCLVFIFAALPAKAAELSKEKLADFLKFIYQYRSDREQNLTLSPLAELLVKNPSVAARFAQNVNPDLQREIAMAFRHQLARDVEVRTNKDLASINIIDMSGEEFEPFKTYLSGESYFDAYTEWAPVQESDELPSDSFFEDRANSLLYESETSNLPEDLTLSSSDVLSALEELNKSFNELTKSLEESLKPIPEGPVSISSSPSKKYIERAKLELNFNVQGGRSPAFRLIDRLYSENPQIKAELKPKEHVKNAEELYVFARHSLERLRAEQDLQGLQAVLQIKSMSEANEALRKRFYEIGYRPDEGFVDGVEAMAFILEQIDLKHRDLNRTYATKLDAQKNPIVMNWNKEVGEEVFAERAQIIFELESLDHAYLLLKNYEKLRNSISKIETGSHATYSSQEEKSESSHSENRSFRSRE